MRSASTLTVWSCFLLAALAVAAEADDRRVMDLAQLVIDAGGFRGTVRSVAFSPGGTLLAASGDQEVRVWRVATGELVATIRGERSRTSYGEILDAVFSPDGRELVVGIADNSDEGSLRVYRIEQLEELSELVPGQGVPVQALEFSIDGRRLASAGDNGEIYIWDWPGRRHMRTIPPIDPAEPVYDVLKFVAARGGPLLSVGVPRPRLHDTTSGREIPAIDYPPQLFKTFQRFAVGDVNYPGPTRKPQEWSYSLRHNRWVVSSGLVPGSPPWIAVYEMGGRDPLAVYRGHRDLVTAMRMDAQGKYTATGDRSGQVHIWETATGRPVHVFKGHYRPILNAAWIEPDDAEPDALPRIALGFHDDRRFERILDLDRRSVLGIRGVTPEFIQGSSEQGDFRVEKKWSDGESFGQIISFRKGRELGRHRLDTNVRADKFAYLPAKTLDADPAVAFTDEYGGLTAWDGSRRDHIMNREFIGHRSRITALAPSPDGKLLLSASLDGTIRIWSLEDRKPDGEFDFRMLSDTIYEIPPTSGATQAGLRKGDRIHRIGGFTLMEVDELRLRGEYPFRGGDFVDLEVLRGSKKFKTEVRLVTGADHVEPLLSVFIDEHDEWIIWTPQGYYDASYGGEQYIGWLVNRGKQQSADYFPVGAFRERLHKPDIVGAVLATAGFGDALDQLGLADSVDARDLGSFSALAPPTVTIRQPRDSEEIANPTVRVIADIQSPSGQSLQEIDVILDGARIELVRTDGMDATVDRELRITPGTHSLKLVARTRDGVESVAAPITFSRPGPVSNVDAPAGMYVLAIGISQFADENLNLNYCHRDAEEFVKLMREFGIYDRSDPEAFKSELLLNRIATEVEIKDRLAAAQDKVGPEDTFVLFISSHGCHDNKGEYYVVPSDGDTDQKRIRGTGVSCAELRTEVYNLQARKKFVFLDTCHAAGAIPKDNPFLKQLDHSDTTVVFVSSHENEYSEENSDFGHGAFTKALLTRVRNEAGKFDVNEKRRVLDTMELDTAVKHEFVNFSLEHLPTSNASRRNRLDVFLAER